MGLLQEIQEMDPKEVAHRPEVKDLWDKSLFWSLAHRRSHRNPLGVEIYAEDQCFEYKRVKEPVPLSAVELALLCWVGAGTNGLIRGDGPVYAQAHDVGWEGTVNASAAYRWFHLLFNNDDGLFLYRRHVPTKVVEIQTQEDMEIIFRAFKEGVTQLSDESIIKDPAMSPAVVPGNDIYTFKPGTTQFFPVIDTTVNFLVLSDHINAGELPEQRLSFIDNQTGESAGLQKWVDNGYIKGPAVPLNFLENYLEGFNYKDAGTCLQGMQLGAAAMGLGVFAHIANMPFMMGVAPEMMRGLGFRWAVDKHGAPYPVGIDGVCEGHLPPYMSMDEAVDDYFNIPFGPKGSLNPVVRDGAGVVYTGFSKEPRAVHRPYKNPDNWLREAQRYAPTPERIQLTKDICNYIYNTYGRFPRQMDPFELPYVIQIHHIDPDFYEEYWVAGTVSEEHRQHLSTWHKLNK